MSALRWLSLLALVAMLVAAPAASAAPDDGLLSRSSGDGVFLPDGDGADDTFNVAGSLSQPSTLTATVHDAAGARIATITEDRSFDAGWISLSWDGRTDGGARAPDGDYEVRVTATSTTGATDQETWLAAIDSQHTAKLLSPTPNAEITGLTRMVVRVPPDVHDVHVDIRGYGTSCCSHYLGSSLGPDVDGTWPVQVDVAPLGHGAAQIWGYAEWTDRLGGRHARYTPEVQVSVRLPPTISFNGAERSFTPDGDGEYDVYAVSAALDAPASVTAKIIRPGEGDAPDQVIRTLFEGQPTGRGGFTPQWDGTTDAGAPAPKGRYELEVTAVDDRGTEETATRRLALDRGPFFTVSAPAAGATVGDEFDVSVTPTPGVELTSFAAGMEQCRPWGCAGVYGPVDDVPARLRLRPYHAAEGLNTVIVTGWYRDAFDTEMSATVRVPVTVARPPNFEVSSVSERFTPDGDDYEEQWSMSSTALVAAQVRAEVRSQAGTVVRDLGEQAVSAGDAYGLWWDGRDDAGAAVPDGRYVVRVVGEGATGPPYSVDHPAIVDSAPVATVIEPAAGARVTGALDVRVRPAPGRSISGAWAYLLTPSGGSVSRWISPGLDGDLSGNIAIPAGWMVDRVQFLVAWSDAEGRSHTSSLVRTIDGRSNVATEAGVSAGCSVISPNGDGVDDDCAFWMWTSSEPGQRRLDVISEEGTVLRRLIPDQPVSGVGEWTSGGWDGRDDAGEVVSDQTVRYRVRVTPDGGDPVDATSEPIAVDTRPVATLVEPAADTQVGGRARVIVAPVAGTEIVRVDTTIDGYLGDRIHAPSPNGTWRTTLDLGGVSDGQHLIGAQVTATRDGRTVRARMQQPVDVDRSRPALLATLTPADGEAPVDAVLRIDASDLQGGTLRYRADFGDDTAPVSGSIPAPYQPIELNHRFTVPGSHLVQVSVEDAEGHATEQTLRATISAPPNAPPTAKLEASTARGPAPLATKFTLGGQDADGDRLTYRLNFGDGSAVVNGDLPAGGPIEHEYRRAGTYIARLEVSDGQRSASSKVKVVAVLGEPVRARAGDDVIVGIGEPVRLDAGDSRPLGAVERYRWELGDGAVASASRVEHTYARAGDYVATLTASAAGVSDTDTVKITVVPDTSPRLDVRVRDTSGNPIAGADVVVVTADGQRHAATTAGDGNARLDALPDGAHTVFAYAPGRRPTTGRAVITAGRGEVVITLADGPTVEAELTSKPMTLSEIRAAGIDTDDPANRHVYQFEVHLNFVGDPGLPPPDPVLVGGYGDGESGRIWWRAPGGGVSLPCTGPCPVVTPGGAVSVVIGGTPQAPTLAALIIPIRESFLKEFFEVQLTVRNLGDPEFTLKDASASLPLPSGLSLAPTARGERSEQQLPDIPGGQQRTASWVLRGDTEGSYDLEASFAAMLDPVDEPISLRAVTTSPLRVWGGSALRTVVEVDDRIAPGHPYHVRVGMENVADVPVHAVKVELLRENRRGYVEQPRERTVQGTDTIAPGATYWTEPWVLVPATASGTLDLRESFVRKTAGDVTLPTEIRPKPRVPAPDDDPKLTVRRHSGGLIAEWDEVPGSTGADLFRQATPEDDFAEPPFEMRPVRGNPRKVFIPRVESVSGSRYALSTVRHGGKREMVHPAVTVDEAGNNDPTIDLTQATRCDQRPWSASVTLSDELGLGGWRWRTVGGAWSEFRSLNGAQTHEAFLEHIDAREIEVQVFSDPAVTGFAGAAGLNSSGEPSQAEPSARVSRLAVSDCTYVALGDSYSSGEGAQDYDSDTDRDGNGCHRSPNAYAYHLLEYRELRLRLAPGGHVACSGAKSPDLENANHSNPREDKPQLDKVRSAQPDVVTMSMGGNDVKFPDIVRDCVIAGVLATPLGIRGEPIPGCATVHARSYLDDRDALRPNLVRLYRKIRELSRPGARIMILEYPHLFPSFDWGRCDGLTTADVAWMHWATENFNRMLEQAASDAGVSFVQADAFGGHDICQPAGTRWFMFPVLDGTTKVEWFHPSRVGHEHWAQIIAARLAEDPAPSFKVSGGEKVLRALQTVGGPATRLVVGIDWPGSTVGLTLISPSGRRITTSTNAPDVSSVVTPTSAQVTVDRPEAGQWKAEIEGIDVADGGEPVTLTSDVVDPPAPQPPLALGMANTATAPAPARVQFDATASFDPDGGAITGFAWDFGDGQDGTGAKPTHTYSAPGTYTPTLRVTDASGAEGSLKLNPIVITAPPAPGGTGPSRGGDPAPSGGAAGSAGGGAAGTPSGGAGAPVVRPPAVTIGKIASRLSRAQLRRGVSLPFTAQRRGVRLDARLTVTGRKVPLARASLQTKRAGKAKLTLRVPAARLRAMRSGTRLSLTVTAVGPGLMPVTRTLSVRLR